MNAGLRAVVQPQVDRADGDAEEEIDGELDHGALRVADQIEGCAPRYVDEL